MPNGRPKGPIARAHIMAALHAGGSTLQEIGNEYGLSRERVRQIIREVEPDATISATKNASQLSPTEAMRAIRSPSVCTLRDAGAIAGCCGQSIERFIGELGMRDAVLRLFRARRAQRRKPEKAAYRERIIEDLRRNVDEHGRPLSTQRNRALSIRAIQTFGTMRAAREAAGFSGDYLDQSWNRFGRDTRVGVLAGDER